MIVVLEIHQPRQGLAVFAVDQFLQDRSSDTLGGTPHDLPVDPETGKLEILKYVVVEDIGHAIKMMRAPFGFAGRVALDGYSDETFQVVS